MSEKKVFEDFPEVDCNQCEPYWNNQCDGTTKGSDRLCNGFRPVRRVKIPEELESLRKRLEWLNVALTLESIVIVAHLLSHIFGWV